MSLTELESQATNAIKIIRAKLNPEEEEIIFIVSVEYCERLFNSTGQMFRNYSEQMWI